MFPVPVPYICPTTLRTQKKPALRRHLNLRLAPRLALEQSGRNHQLTAGRGWIGRENYAKHEPITQVNSIESLGNWCISEFFIFREPVLTDFSH